MASIPKAFTWDDIARINEGGAAPAAKTSANGDGAGQRQVLFVIAGKVYDIAEFSKSHPGGQVILTYTGKDATDVFQALHDSSTEDVLADLYVGDLVTSPPKSAAELRSAEFTEEVRALLQKYRKQGYFKSNKLYYVFKLVSTTALALASIALVVTNGSSTLSVFVAGVLLALFWQQSGWLAHDVLHHQVFGNRSLNRALGYLVGNVYQGFSVAWWTDKHTTHHAVPNIHDEDPDIDTMPLLAWSEHALSLFSEMPEPGASKAFLRYQAFYFFPLLALARLSWAIQSITFVSPMSSGSFFTSAPHKRVVHNPAIEMVTLFLHWAWYFGLMAKYLTLPHAILYFVTSQAGCGLFLALVFALNHNGMPIFTRAEFQDMDFFPLQVVTGRDVKPSVAANWFTGGLNFQIEHHLFPKLPRHNFYLVQEDVERLCKKYSIPYHTTGFFEGTFEVLQRLQSVAGTVDKI